MVTPYLSRLRPAEPGRRLHPRPRSRFEPAPALPIDGPAIASLGLSFPPTWDAEAAGAEIEVEQDTPYPFPPRSAVAAATPGEQGPPPVRTTTPEPDPSPPRSAVAAATPGEQGPSPVRTTTPEPDPQDEERAPTRAARADRPTPRTTAPAGNSRRQAPESYDEDFSPTPGERAGPPEHDPAPSIAARRSGPPTQRALPDQPPVFGGLASPGAEAAPPESAPPQHPRPAPQQGLSASPPPGPPAAPLHSPQPAPHLHSNRTSQEAEAPQTAPRRPDDVELPAARRPDPRADAAADRVKAMARWLRGADAAFAGPEAAMRSPIDPQQAQPPPIPVLTLPVGHTEVTVTIGRIEVKAPAADAGPARPPSRGPRRQPPTLGDYLQSRARARGRPR